MEHYVFPKCAFVHVNILPAKLYSIRLPGTIPQILEIVLPPPSFQIITQREKMPQEMRAMSRTSPYVDGITWQRP